MAANPFDQFDAPAQPAETSGNPFDQFDTPAQQQQPRQLNAETGLPEFPSMPGEVDNARPMSEAFDSFGKRAKQYIANLGTANERAVGSMRGTPDLGTVEAAGSLLTGGLVAPIIGTAESIAFGTDPDESFKRYTYEPRTQSGKAQLGYLGALIQPLRDSGADVALAPLFAGEAGAARVPANARSAAIRRRPVPGAGDQVVETAAPVQAVQKSAAAERPAGLASVSQAAPTLEKLRADKNAAYKRSEEAGVQLSEFSFKKLKGKVLNEIGERIDPTLHPDTTAAVKRLIDTKGAVSLEKLDQLRQIANDAKGSIKPADQRLASKVVESIDEYLDGISPKDITRGDPKGAAALVEARALNTRLKKGEQIEELFRRAEIKAGANYSQSGLENSLRSEFKALALDAKKMKRFTPEERAAITKVAKGAPLENALRFVGKFAPTGVVSATLSGGLGAMLAGPAGAALPLAGLAGRAAATRMTLRNAQRASETVRRGRNALVEEPALPAKTNALLEY